MNVKILHLKKHKTVISRKVTIVKTKKWSKGRIFSTSAFIAMQIAMKHERRIEQKILFHIGCR
jgi:hypothetical protein